MNRRRLISALCAFAVVAGVTFGRAEYTSIPIRNFVTSVFGRVGDIVATAADYAAFYLKLPGYTTSTLYCADSPYNVAAANSRAANDTGIQACITAAIAGGYEARMPVGTLQTSANFTCNGPVRVVGSTMAGIGVGQGSQIGTKISGNNASGDTFKCTTFDAVQFENLTIENTGGSSGAAIYVKAGSLSVTSCIRGTRINNVHTIGHGTGIYIEAGCNFVLSKNSIFVPTGDGITVDASTNNLQDIGDSAIYGNVIWDISSTASGAGLRLIPAGGMFITQNKILGFGNSIELDAKTAITGTVLMGYNSLEEYRLSALRVGQVTAGVPFNYIIFSSNQAQSFQPTQQAGIAIQAGAAQYVQKMIIAHSLIISHGSTYAAPTCINLADGLDVIVDHVNCTIDGNANPATTYVTSGNAQNVSINHGRDSGFTNRYSLGISTLIDDLVGLAFAAIPTTNVANGSRLFISDADPASGPCTSAGAKTGATAFRQNVAWKCF